MDEINTRAFEGSKTADYDAEDTIPYKDIETIADKVNEIVRWINKWNTKLP